MEYQRFNPDIHDSRQVATLIYDVDFRTFDRLFRSSDAAISAIEKTLKDEEYLRVIMDDGGVVGMLKFYTHDMKSKATLTSLRLLIVDIMDHFVICDIEKDDFYVAELAIDKAHRSKGYGTRVLNDIIGYAKKHSYKRVILDADFRNPKARALYERLGFKVFNKKSFLKRGMYNMELKIS